MLKFQDDVLKNLRNRNCTVALSLDVEKAFDHAYHDGILYKIILIGVDSSIIKIEAFSLIEYFVFNLFRMLLVSGI